MFVDKSFSIEFVEEIFQQEFDSYR
jgi:hypothetical protein